ncbi:hypothetical protein Q8A67_024411 [Cirrhinus molitorella]|uniref:Uncharacterized protein n=1 Tax=Cirrhinus molitorella TaxID=172907 RepID=A0AA88TDG2_9TELE|nr:hypothetical protein Q8A67_024411 [Cirrhinus molitorella]
MLYFNLAAVFTTATAGFFFPPISLTLSRAKMLIWSRSEVACAKLPSIDRSVQQPVKAGEMALDLPLLSTWTNMSSPRGSKRGHVLTLVRPRAQMTPGDLRPLAPYAGPLRSHPEGGPVTRREFSIR